MNVRYSDKLEWFARNGELVLRTYRFDPNSKTIVIYSAAIEALRPDDTAVAIEETKSLCLKTLGNGQWDEDEHPRADDGKFGSGPGSSKNPPGAEQAAEPEVHPQVVPQEGDEWNRALGLKLEKEYQAVKSDLENIVTLGNGQSVDAGPADEDELNENAPYVPDHWDGMSEDLQDQVKQEWMSDNKSSYVDQEHNYWYESGGALDDAKNQLAYNFSSSDPDTDWAADTIKDWLEERKENDQPVPYTETDLLDSLKISYDGNGEGSEDPDIEFDDDYLKNPEGYDPNQMTLPGIDPIEPSSFLTDEMRDDLKHELTVAFNKKADDKSGSMEPPEYLSDNVDESMENDWDHNLDDDAKFDYAKNNTSIIDDLQKEYDDYYENNGNMGDVIAVNIPKQFDPLQSTGDSDDYQKTHALVTYMSRTRAGQLLEARGLIASGTAGDYKNDIRDIDNSLWKDWKGSSAGSFGGQILQLATHEELGGRYREMPTHRDDLIKQADSKWKEIGGFAGIKAMVRAKWETSQYALDKAGVQSLIVYRGLRVPGMEDQPVEEVKEEYETAGGAKANQTYERFTNAHLSRNGCYSTTTKRDVANNWSAGTGQKVVLRIDAPRTAVLSFPAYGINVHSEKEVVLAGTAFRGWDAWKDVAPSYGSTPMISSKMKEAA